MYILKNAFISITRNIGRNLLIGIIIVVISCACAITLAIRNSASALITSYQNQYEVTATIGINRESMRGNMQMDREASQEEKETNKENMNTIFASISNISTDEIHTYGESEYVKSYYYQKSIGVNSLELEPASTTTATDSSEQSFGGKGGKQDFTNQTNSDFTLEGYSSIEGMQDFISGKYSITSGEVSSDIESDTCVINSELATLNNIEVGATITLVDPDNENNTITLTVTGIFEEISDTEDAMGMFTSSVNKIITNTNVVEKLMNVNSEMKATTTPTFILTSKDVISSFEEELTEKGLSEYLSLSTNLDQVESATSTISNVSTFALTFLIITLLIGGIVLFVINMINIRERKYEIGVLRTIGMKKSLLTLQFVSELLMVAIISLAIGAGIGSLASVPVSNYLLDQEIHSAEEQVSDVNRNFGGANKEKFNNVNGIATVQAFDSIDAVVDLKVLGELFVIGILLTLISSSASMISIQKFSPLTILKERG